MWKKTLINLFKPSPQSVLPIRVIVKSANGVQQTLQCKQNDNLMDATNKSVNQNINVYGLCDKQLACTTCSVQILNLYQKIPNPNDQELDILYGLKDYKDRCTRMACQIKIRKQLDGMVVKIPKKTNG